MGLWAAMTSTLSSWSTPTVLLVTGGLVATTGGAAVVLPRVLADDCDDVVVVGARGSGQALPEDLGAVDDEPLADYVEGVREGLAAADISMTFRQVPYEARDFPFPDVITELEPFVASLYTGGEVTEATLQQVSADCPDAMVVVTGFSQGAAAASTALRSLSPTLHDRVVSAQLFSDPLRRGDDPTADGGAPAELDGAMQVFGDITRHLPDWVADRATTWCLPDDDVCALRRGTDVNPPAAMGAAVAGGYAHFAYADDSTITGVAALETVDHVRAELGLPLVADRIREVAGLPPSAAEDCPDPSTVTTQGTTMECLDAMLGGDDRSPPPGTGEGGGSGLLDPDGCPVLETSRPEEMAPQEQAEQRRCAEVAAARDQEHQQSIVAGVDAVLERALGGDVQEGRSPCAVDTGMVAAAILELADIASFPPAVPEPAVVDLREDGDDGALLVCRLFTEPTDAGEQTQAYLTVRRGGDLLGDRWPTAEVWQVRAEELPGVPGSSEDRRVGMAGMPFWRPPATGSTTHDPRLLGRDAGVPQRWWQAFLVVDDRLVGLTVSHEVIAGAPHLLDESAMREAVNAVTAAGPR